MFLTWADIRGSQLIPHIPNILITPTVWHINYHCPNTCLRHKVSAYRSIRSPPPCPTTPPSMRCPVQASHHLGYRITEPAMVSLRCRRIISQLLTKSLDSKESVAFSQLLMARPHLLMITVNLSRMKLTVAGHASAVARSTDTRSI